jgi:uracil-DNA glycosylase
MLRVDMNEDSLHVYYLKQMGIDCWVKRVDSKDKQLRYLAREISTCMACGFDASALYADFSYGNPDASCMVVTEARTEGVLFNNMLASIQMNPDMIYTTHLLKCQTHLKAQIDIVQPLFILILNATPVSIQNDNEIPVITTYHPEVLLQKPQLKKKTWIELQKMRRLMNGE